MVAATVGTSVWPAEYSVASPYAERRSVTARSERSRPWDLPAMGRRVGLQSRIRLGRRIERRRLGTGGQGPHFMRRRVGGEPEVDIVDERGVDPEVAGDHARHEWCDIRAFAR